MRGRGVEISIQIHDSRTDSHFSPQHVRTAALQTHDCVMRDTYTPSLASKEMGREPKHRFQKVLND